ncbi:MAG: alpha/beta hydrolase [Acidaminococcales bacterium]|jgi:putative redox protein|nr:alpha/beta hydrolase [Acidaminococcales bacterium]
MRDIVIPCADYNLPGFLHPARANSGQAASLIVSHGFRGSPDGGGRAPILAQAASEHFNVIRFPFTPLSSLSRQIEELLAVIAYARGAFGSDVVLLGRSMGGAASLLAAAKARGVRGLILWSTPFAAAGALAAALGKENMDKLRLGRPAELDDEWGKGVLPPDFYTDLLTYDLFAAFDALPDMPLLFVHGEKDELAPPEDAQRAFALARGNKRFCLVKGGDHRFVNGFSDSLDAVMVWLKDNYGRNGIC